MAMLHFPFPADQSMVSTARATPDLNHENFARLIQILAPGAGDIVAMMECYFDETESGDDSEFIAVSGYIFSKENAISLDHEWRDLLVEFGTDGIPLPYFRMSACAHGNDPFDRLSAPQRDMAARAALGLIKKYMTYGFSASVRMKDYRDWLPPEHNTVGDAYVWCCWMCLVAVRVWADRSNFAGDIAYFFESGHVHQTQANGVMKRIFKSPLFRSQYRYASHAFVSKEKNRPIQTGDILAWQHLQDFKRYLSGKPRRKDFAALLDGDDGKYRVLHGKKELFDDLREVGQFVEMLKSIKTET